MVALSILDLVDVETGVEPAEALRRSVELARSAEAWGYRRYWVGEHHSYPGSASSSPAVFLTHLAHVTSRIRLGSGGVMLTNHAPIVVAEQFGILSTFFPGRIDLGVGRAPGALPAVAQALRRSADDGAPDAFAGRVSELLGFLGRGFQQEHPYARDHVFAMPPAPGVPVWMLGNSKTGGELAGLLGLPFAAAWHINAQSAIEGIEAYLSSFQPSPALVLPYVMVSVTAVCADTGIKAMRLARSGPLMRVLIRKQQQTAVPTPEQAARYRYSADERRFVDQLLGDAAIGTPRTVRARLTEIQAQTGANELMLTSVIPGFTQRMHSYELIAKEFALS
ncbi:LLM class flavin-dependent oxidoreductase [Actinoplanes sp. TBRC 11911]|uniref:LLM class flavin-dependent oxidoreductase n=1 Tax=Actinoplanes sp. TBRC 11911 TaxID=2729386 RepID=UPI00145CAB46|nr:LLM class flavin-dependent oxidoreductase [Actinoplanes sp. TBRC 11911]NMO53343.1 LLM class flavin-dependent oxidoreductase [Actinoplanes sp. TBRC 11911]